MQYKLVILPIVFRYFSIVLSKCCLSFQSQRTVPVSVAVSFSFSVVCCMRHKLYTSITWCAGQAGIAVSGWNRHVVAVCVCVCVRAFYQFKYRLDSACLQDRQAGLPCRACRAAAPARLLRSWPPLFVGAIASTNSYTHIHRLTHTCTLAHCYTHLHNLIVTPSKQANEPTIMEFFRAVLSSYIQCTFVCVCVCGFVCVCDNTNNLMTLTFGFVPYFSLVLLALHVHVHVHGK